jgi:hypothetical protein
MTVGCSGKRGLGEGVTSEGGIKGEDASPPDRKTDELFRTLDEISLIATHAPLLRSSQPGKDDNHSNRIFNGSQRTFAREVMLRCRTPAKQKPEVEKKLRC